MMGPRVPDKQAGIPFSLPTDSCTGSGRQMVEQHHLSLYKLVNNASSFLDNQEPESWKLQQEWKRQSKRQNGGATVWNLDSAAMERMLAIEQAGAQFIVDNDSTAFSVLAEVKEAMDLKGMELIVAIRSFQNSDENGLTKDELGQLIGSFEVDCSAKMLRTLFREISLGQELATFADLEAAFLRAKDSRKGVSMNLKTGGSDRLLKLLSGRATKLKEIFELFDPDGDGTITVEEFAQGLNGLHLNPTAAEVDALMAEFDQDNDGTLTYREFSHFIAGRKRVSRKKQLKDLDTRLNTFAQSGMEARMKRTPRVWTSMLTEEIEKRLIDNIDVIEKALVKKEKARPVEGQYRKHVRPTDLWRVLLEQLGLKISHDHFTHFIQRLPRQQVSGVELVDYQPFLDHWRKVDAKRKSDRIAKSKKMAEKRRDQVFKVMSKPAPTRHDSVATAVVEAITGASWGTRLQSEIKKQRARAMTYYLEDPSILAMDSTERPKFEQWLEQGPQSDHRRTMARKVMKKVEEMRAQEDEEGTHAIMLAFKLSDRDEEGNTGVTGFLSPEVFKDTIREICGTRMQGWNDFEGMYNVSPRQLDYCVEIAEKVPAQTKRWQFRDDTGQWRDYEPEDGKKIQDVKDARDKSSLEMKIRGRLYRIDLLSMEQTLINKMPELQDSPDERDGRKREIHCAGEPNENAGMVIYRSFFARLAKCSAQAQYEQFKRAGGANRRGSLGDLESETRKLLGGVTYELQQALAAKVQQMGGEEAMRVAFEKFDENGDGQISPEELKTGLQALDIRGANGKRISDDEIDKLCVVLDQDDDGCISYEEFVAQFGAAPRQSAREALGTMSKELQDVIRKNKTNLRKIFHAFDEDGDGSISAQELRLGLRALNLDVSAIQVKDMINLLDANGDGSIDWNEFQAVFGGENVVAKGISRSYRRVLESRQRIASEHPEIVSMRNKAANTAKASGRRGGGGLGKGAAGKDSAEEGERIRIDEVRTKVRAMLHGHRVRLVDAFRVFDANNSKRLGAASFEKMLMYFDPSKKTINVDDVRLLFRKLDKTSSGSGGGKAAAAGEQPGTVSLSAVRAFFGSDC